MTETSRRLEVSSRSVHTRKRILRLIHFGFFLTLVQPSEMFSDPRTAYEKALKKAGPIIGVRRKGRVRNE